MACFIGEVRLMPYSYVPTGWLLCDGTQYQINNTNRALASIIGKAYGGDGITTFNVPDLRDMIPVGASASNPTGVELGLGQTTGAATVTLSPEHVAPHTHSLNGRTAQNASYYTSGPGPGSSLGNVAALSNIPGKNPVIQMAFFNLPSGGNPNTQLSPGVIGPDYSGSALAHNNQQPFLTIAYMIAYQGIFL